MSRFLDVAQSTNSSNKIWPPPFLSILANSAPMSAIGPTHNSTVDLIAGRVNSSLEMRLSFPVSILLEKRGFILRLEVYLKYILNVG